MMITQISSGGSFPTLDHTPFPTVHVQNKQSA